MAHSMLFAILHTLHPQVAPWEVTYSDKAAVQHLRKMARYQHAMLQIN